MDENTTVAAPAEAVQETVVAPVQPVETPPQPAPETPAEIEPAELSAPAANLTEASEQLAYAQMTNEAPETLRALQLQLETFRRADAPAPTEPVVAVTPAATSPTETEPASPTGEQPSEEDGPLPARVRTTHMTETDRALHNAVISLTKAGIPLSEAVQRVMGTSAPAPAETPGEAPIPEPAPTVDLETERAEINARIETQEAIIRDHGEREALPTVELASAHIELAKLRGDLSDLRVKALEQQLTEVKSTSEASKAEAQARHKQAEDAAFTAACETYPDLENSDSALWRLTKMEADEAKADASHPLHGMVGRPDFVKYAAEAAAKRYGKAPAQAKSVPAPNATAAPVPKPPGPASPSKGSTPTPAPVSQAERIAKSEAALMATLTGEPVSEGLVSRKLGIIR